MNPDVWIGIIPSHLLPRTRRRVILVGEHSSSMMTSFHLPTSSQPLKSSPPSVVSVLLFEKNKCLLDLSLIWQNSGFSSMCNCKRQRKYGCRGRPLYHFKFS